MWAPNDPAVAKYVATMHNFMFNLHGKGLQPLNHAGDLWQHVHREFNTDADYWASRPLNAFVLTESVSTIAKIDHFLVRFDGSSARVKSGCAIVLYSIEKPLNKLKKIAYGVWDLPVGTKAAHAELAAANQALLLTEALVQGRLLSFTWRCPKPRSVVQRS